MAKQGKAQQARRPAERFDESALLRSAETLGRMIGALQRQLDGAARRFGLPVPAGETANAEKRAIRRSNGRAATIVKARKKKTAGTKPVATMRPKAVAARPGGLNTANANPSRAKKTARRT